MADHWRSVNRINRVNDGKPSAAQGCGVPRQMFEVYAVGVVVSDLDRLITLRRAVFGLSHRRPGHPNVDEFRSGRHAAIS